MARENEVEGKVIRSFVVETDGRLSRPSVVRGIGYGCDKEALRLINLMPRWQPGRQNARNIPVLYTLPVTFNLKYLFLSPFMIEAAGYLLPFSC